MKKLYVLLTVALLFASTAHAAVGVKYGNTSSSQATTVTSTTTSTGPLQVTDINFQGSPTVSFDGATLNIDSSVAAITSGTITGATINNSAIGATTPANLNYLRPVVVIADTPNTLSTVGSYNQNNSIVTTTNSGSAFVLTAPGSSQAGASFILSLPGTHNTVSGSLTGLTYTFSTATGTTLAIRTSSSTDSTIIFGPVNCTRITSPASSGSTVTVVGNGSTWFIASIGANGSSWASGSF